MNENILKKTKFGPLVVVVVEKQSTEPQQQDWRIASGILMVCGVVAYECWQKKKNDKLIFIVMKS